MYVCSGEREHKKQKWACSVISLRLDTPTPAPVPHAAAARKALQRCKLHFHNLWGPNNCLHLILQPFCLSHRQEPKKKRITRMKEMNTAGLGNSIN